MPRPFLARKPPAARAAANVSDPATSAAPGSISKPAPMLAAIATSAAKPAPSKKGKVAQIAANAMSRVTRTRKAGGAPAEATPEPLTEAEEQDSTLQAHGEDEPTPSASQRITRGRAQSEEPKKQTRKKGPVLQVGMDKPETAAPKRSTRSTRAAPLDEIASPQKTSTEIDTSLQLTATKASASTKLPVAAKSTRKKQDLGEKENAAEDEEQELVPTSPVTALPIDASLGVVDDLDDFSSTSSMYGDENFLPSPLAQSTPKPGPSMLVTPSKPKPQIGFRDDEGYTPPKPRTLGGVVGPSLLSPRKHSPTRRRLWDSSSVASSPQPSPALQEVPKTAADLPDGPINFNIYEDPNRASASPMRPAFSHLMDVDARGDGAGSNVLRTPKKARPEVTKKRTSSGGQKTPEGQVVDDEKSSDDSADDSDSGTSGSDTETPIAQKTRTKRLKQAQPLSTKELLDLAPRRKRVAGRATRQKAPVVVSDDLGEDVTSDLEDELVAGAMKRATAKKGAKTTLAKGKKSETAAKAASKTTKSRARQESAEPSKAPKSKGRRTYGRAKSTAGDESDASMTPVSGDKEDETLPPPVPSSDSGPDKVGFTRDVRVQMKELKKKFAEVDEWDLQFEDVTASSSLNSEV
ncbi:hypothetical protein DFH27DRAFT_605252 [Peziza echinospora]|nr:hypothetical protein DFH27DRAFT_605252 [Peziza echinospora]